MTQETPKQRQDSSRSLLGRELGAEEYDVLRRAHESIPDGVEWRAVDQEFVRIGIEGRAAVIGKYALPTLWFPERERNVR